jgi:hypothetical protein
MPFFMVLAKRPISLQKKGPKDRYQESIRAAARQILNDTESLSLQGDLYIRILWFHSQQTSQDVDNIIKPIVDSLKSIVFEDDARISQCLVVRIDVRRGDFALPTRNVPTEVYNHLVALLAENVDHILYVEVGQVFSQQVVFGPIDGVQP